ncbi:MULTISPECIES: hypothetical protein [unclassified Pedobacter]|jgi:hypothetical protein|uniref:hypothetical protein n=1 Tax=Pedobacter TaxID=84567 RepID=UPI0015560826|nr:MULTISPECIES: hypothetical protein [unclassified Pedobacter]MCX2430294.1 hypothetical protein [Pedobacter sp. GR22-10]MCX2585754.1 hypothetical protein [Pedobacter sp. MR22-3]
MNRKIKVLFITALSAICMMNPACRHATNDGQEIYRRYAIKNIRLISRHKL